MAISTNSIIHYTRTIEALKGILKEGFKIKFCSEHLTLGSDNGNGSRAAHPLVSFCDIPLSDAKQHYEAYGKYGIGLTKEWAIKNGANPVLYISKDSLIAKNIYNLIVERRKSKSRLNASLKHDILKIKAYSKNYTGRLQRNGKLIDYSYKFYNEREWRIVPLDKELNGALFSIDLSFYEKDKEKYNAQLESVRIKFEPEDVSYIIVDKTIQIPELIEFLKVVYKDKYNSKQLDILFSKLCSTEQIEADY